MFPCLPAMATIDSNDPIYSTLLGEGDDQVPFGDDWLDDVGIDRDASGRRAGASATPAKADDKAPAEEKFAIGDQAPEFKIKDAEGEEIDLAELTADGPVLVRLTCGCSGCDKELAYFQELHEAYEGKGLTSLAIFKEPDAKVEAYVKEKKLNMLYAVDTKGEAGTCSRPRRCRPTS